MQMNEPDYRHEPASSFEIATDLHMATNCSSFVMHCVFTGLLDSVEDYDPRTDKNCVQVSSQA